MVIFNPNLIPPVVRVDYVYSFAHLARVIRAYAVLVGFPKNSLRVSGRFVNLTSGAVTDFPAPVAAAFEKNLLRINGVLYEYITPFTVILSAVDDFVEESIRREITSTRITYGLE